MTALQQGFASGLTYGAGGTEQKYAHQKPS
jgi:hypothetical protein